MLRKIVLYTVITVLVIMTGGYGIEAVDKESGSVKNDDSEIFSVTESDDQEISSPEAGINLGNALDSYGLEEYKDITEFETSFHNCIIKPTLFKFIKNSGFKTVRIPVTWMDHINDDGVIEEEWMVHVGEVVKWAMDAGLYVIIDVHHDTWTVPSYENEENALSYTEKVWGQIAEYFKSYDQTLFFEGFNEPRLIGTEQEWQNGTEETYEVLNKMNACFVNTVRGTGGKNKERLLLITGYRTGADKEILDNIRLPKDSNIALSVHAYIPYEFASSKKGTNYWSSDNVEDTEPIDRMFDDLEKYSKENNIHIIMTECGALDKDNQECRLDWCRYFVSKARKSGIQLIWWDNNYPAYPLCGYSLMDRVNEKIVNQEIVDILTKE